MEHPVARQPSRTSHGAVVGRRNLINSYESFFAAIFFSMAAIRRE